MRRKRMTAKRTPIAANSVEEEEEEGKEEGDGSGSDREVASTKTDSSSHMVVIDDLISSPTRTSKKASGDVVDGEEVDKGSEEDDKHGLE